jgi:hypothetical protein
MAECNSDVIKFLVDRRVFDTLATLHARKMGPDLLEMIEYTLCQAMINATPAQLMHILTVRTADVFVDAIHHYLTILRDGDSLRTILTALKTACEKWEPRHQSGIEHILRGGLGLSIKSLRGCEFDAQVCTDAKSVGKGSKLDKLIDAIVI